MIICNLTGGLGNQMFQYAFGRRLTIKNKTQLKYHFTNALLNTPRRFELDVFKIKATPATDRDLKNMGIIKNQTLNRIFYLLDERLGININKHIVTEKKGQQFDPNILNLRGDFYVQGFWQDKRYFEDIKNIVRNDFTFKNKLDSKNKNVLELIKKTNSVGIHVRRGDYVTNKMAPNFIGLDYYLKEIKKKEERAMDLSFFVFSDDIHWCKKNLKSKRQMYFVAGNKDANAWKDMLLMSQCKEITVANSSFSWWAYWLNKNTLYK